MPTSYPFHNGVLPCLYLSLLMLNASAQEKIDAISVATSRPKIGLLVRSTSQPAAVHPFFEAELASRVSGYVKSVNFDIGDKVKAGDVLAIIDTPELKTQAERKEAEILFLQSKTKQLEAGTQAVKAETRAQELEFDRISRLAKTGAITKRARDEAESRLEGARAKMAVVLDEVESSKAAVLVANKELEELHTMIGFASLRSPFDGTVTHRALDPGDRVKSADSGKSNSPLFRIARLDKIRVRVAIPELDSVYVNPGDHAVFTCRALRGKSFPCTVSRTSGSVDKNTGSMTVELDLENQDGKLIPGLFGTIIVELERFEKAITLSANSVRFDEKGGNTLVYIVENGAVKVVPVEIGYDDGSRIQILRGLNGNEPVINGMLGRFTGGEKVTVRNPDSGAK